MSQLQFKSLTFENFKTFSGSHTFSLERAPGLYYITGKNNLNPELGANGVGKSTLFDALIWVLWGKTGRDNRPADAIKPWVGKGRTQVQLWFTRNGQDHFIYRTRNPNSLRHSIDASDDDKEITQDDIPKLIGMSEAMFRRTLVLGQFGELFLDLKPEAQAQMFTEALSLDIWLKAVQTATKASNLAANNEIRAMSAQDANERLLKEVAVDITDAESRADLFEQDKAARIAKINKGVETLKLDLLDLEEDPVEAPSPPAQTKSSTIKVQLATLAGDIRATTRTLDRLKADLDTAEGDLNFFKQQKGKVKVCRECGQEISNEDFTDKMQAAKDKAAALLAETQKELTASAGLRAKSKTLEANLEAAIQSEADAVRDYRVLLEQYNSYSSKLSACRAELQRQSTALKQEQASVNSAAESLARFRTRRSGYRASQGELKEAAAQAAREAQAATFWVSAFREIRLSIIDQALLELEMAASRHAAMLGLEDWGIKFDTEKETQSGKVSYGFSVFLYPPGQDDPVKWESYSGGESQRMQLAVAFGLSEVLLARAGLAPNIEVLDEPTRGLSSDGVADLLEHLRDRALELGRAIYFCDHHSLDKGAFDGTLQVTKEKSGSTLKWL